MKKTCDRCRALSMLQGCPAECILGHPIDARLIRPLDECPKPLNYQALCDALKEVLSPSTGEEKCQS